MNTTAQINDPQDTEAAKTAGKLTRLLKAARALQARGFFEPTSCADKATQADMRALRRALDDCAGLAPDKKPKRASAA